jgi:hypothetical protein
MATTINGIVNENIGGNADILASKSRARKQKSYSQTGNIVAATEYFHLPPRAGTLKSIKAMVTETAAAGAYAAAVDLKKSTGAGAFASVLSAALTLDSAVVLRNNVTGSISDTALATGDCLAIVVTVSGASGTRPAGLCVTVEWEDNSGN